MGGDRPDHPDRRVVGKVSMVKCLFSTGRRYLPNPTKPPKGYARRSRSGAFVGFGTNVRPSGWTGWVSMDSDPDGTVSLKSR
jgi:hypothetical protein